MIILRLYNKGFMKTIIITLLVASAWQAAAQETAARAVIKIEPLPVSHCKIKRTATNTDVSIHGTLVIIPGTVWKMRDGTVPNLACITTSMYNY